MGTPLNKRPVVVFYGGLLNDEAVDALRTTYNIYDLTTLPAKHGVKVGTYQEAGEVKYFYYAVNSMFLGSYEDALLGVIHHSKRFDACWPSKVMSWLATHNIEAAQSASPPYMWSVVIL